MEDKVKPSLILKNGSIYTVNKGYLWAQAIAISGEMIVFVGTDNDVEVLVDSETEVIDLDGKMILPSFIDAHAHSSHAIDLMVVALTNALALVIGETLHGLGGEVDVSALFTLILLVGVIMFLLGVLKLGSIIRFVSKEVMAGFVFATALLIVLGQYDDLAIPLNKLFLRSPLT